MRQFSCMVVDDEPMIVERLKAFFARQSGSFQLIAYAYSGEEALELARQTKPDIVLTDIVMPGMDGIELIRHLKAELDNVHCIILSAHTEFNYARQALQLNVKDYIAKVPLSEEELLQALGHAAEVIVEQEQQRAQVHHLEHSRLGHIHRVRRSVLLEYLEGQLSVQRLMDQQDDLQIRLPARSYTCFLIRMRRYDEFVGTYSGTDQSLIRYGMVNLIEETIREHAEGFAFADGQYDLICFADWDDIHSTARLTNACMELAQSLLYRLDHFMKQQVAVVFGDVYHGAGTMPEAYRQIRRLSEDLYYTREQSVHTPRERLAYTPEHNYRCREAFDQWVAAACRGSAEQVDGSLEQLASRIIPYPADPAFVQRMIVESAERIGVQAGLQAGESSLYSDPFPPAPEFRLQLAWLAKISKVLLAKTETHWLTRREITRAKQFIAEHLSTRLTLQQVADHVNLSPSYFSLVFKQQEGVTLMDYMNRTRIERAMELLDRQDISNVLLSEQIGLYNERYFCTLFKQYTGLTPQKYRRQRKKG